jgi:hypothetical protein
LAELAAPDVLALPRFAVYAVLPMLTADARFEGWNTDDWTRFIELWAPRAPEPDVDASRARGGLLAIHEGGKLRKLLHTRRGRIEPMGWPVPLDELARAEGASWAASIQKGALEEIMERFGARAKRGDDLTVQVLAFLQIVRAMMREGQLELWPHRLRGLPLPNEAMVRRAVDALCGDGRAVCLGLFHEGALHTSFVARRRGRGFDVIAGPDELRRDLGALSGDLRRDFRKLVRAAEERYAPLAFGCFAEVSRFRELLLDGRPGAWSRAVLLRDVVLSPMPAPIALAVGFDGARYAFDRVKVVSSAIDPFGFVEPALRAARKRIGAAVGGKDLEGVLGFDPIAALRALLRR